MMMNGKTVKQQHLSVYKKLLFSLIIVVVFFLVAEAFLSALDFSFEAPLTGINTSHWGKLGFQQDPELSWSWVPLPGAKAFASGAAYEFNELGFRGEPVEKKKPSGVSRIVCMGDSCTIGWEVRLEDSFCYRLEKILEQTSPQPVETINAGVPGYTTFQGLHYLRSKVLSLEPDAIVFSYNWNDHTFAIHMHETLEILLHKTFKGLPDNELPSKNALTDMDSFLSTLRSYQLMEYALWKWKTRQPPTLPEQNEEEEIDPSFDLDEIPLRVSLKDYRANLLEFVRISRENKIRPIFLTQPSQPLRSNHAFKELAKSLAFEPENDQEWMEFCRLMSKVFERMQQKYNEEMKKVARFTGTTVVDMAGVFREVGRPQDLLLDPVHPTPKGHELIAQQLAEAIR